MNHSEWMRATEEGKGDPELHKLHKTISIDHEKITLNHKHTHTHTHGSRIHTQTHIQ